MKRWDSEGQLMISSNIETACYDIRKAIIEAAYKCGHPAHLGGSLSMVELLSVLFGEVMRHRPADPHWNERDIFILSKGHAVLGYLATLHYYGYFDREKLFTFQSNDSDFIAHPIKNIDLGIESSNGSLGQGLSYGLGLAMGMSKLKQDRRVFVLLGDGECNEGSVWEAAALAAERDVSNLVAIVDQNRLRNDGATATYEGRINLAKVWSAFGWNVIEVDGHDTQQIRAALSQVPTSTGAPTAIVAQTTKGKGIPVMEANNEWHHNRITASLFEECMKALEPANV